MSSLYLVRHGQASFFTEDYDKLSPDGKEQARCLGRFWRRRGLDVVEVYTGTLKRQVETAHGVGEDYTHAGLPWPDPVTLPGLDEYDADGILGVLGAELNAKDATARRLMEEYENSETNEERYRTFHRVLEAVTRFWVEGEYESRGIETWPTFRGRVREALTSILERGGRGRRIAAFTSAGPVGVILQTVLSAPDGKAAELHWRLHNASVTELTFTDGRISVDSFNATGHLEPKLLTYR